MILLFPLALAAEASVSWYEAGPGRELEVHLDLPGEVQADQVKLSVQDRPAEVTQVQRFGETGEGAAIALLIDTVGYDKTQQASLQAAGKAFVANMQASDQAAVLGVGSTLQGLDRDPLFTADPPGLYRQLEALPFDQDSTTALWRGCVQALEAMDAPGLPDRKALILLSDGFDRTRTTHQDCIQEATARQIPVFTAWYRPSRHQDEEGHELLRAVAEKTGGDFVEQPPDNALDAMMRSVQDRLRDQLVVRALTADHDQGDLPVRVQLSPELAVVERLRFPQACCEGEAPLEVEEEGGLDPRKLVVAGVAVLLLLGGAWLMFGGRRQAQPPTPRPAPTRPPAPTHEPEPTGGSSEPHRAAPRTAMMVRGWAIQATEGSLAGQRFPITEQGLRLGADVSNDAVVPDPGISSFHCRLIPTERGVEVVDLGSTNGTWVQSERIESALLGPGERFVTGGHTFEVTNQS